MRFRLASSTSEVLSAAFPCTSSAAGARERRLRRDRRSADRIADRPGHLEGCRASARQRENHRVRWHTNGGCRHQRRDRKLRRHHRGRRDVHGHRESHRLPAATPAGCRHPRRATHEHHRGDGRDPDAAQCCGDHGLASSGKGTRRASVALGRHQRNHRASPGDERCRPGEGSARHRRLQRWHRTIDDRCPRLQQRVQRLAADAAGLPLCRCSVVARERAVSLARPDGRHRACGTAARSCLRTLRPELGRRCAARDHEVSVQLTGHDAVGAGWTAEHLPRRRASCRHRGRSLRLQAERRVHVGRRLPVQGSGRARLDRASTHAGWNAHASSQPARLRLRAHER